MTGNTIGRGGGIGSGSMAFRAIGNFMALGQREKIVIDFIGMPIETRHLMAFDTIGGKTGAFVIGVGAGSVIVAVAIDAIVSDAVESQTGFGFVAVGASGQRMSAHQGKTIVLVQCGNVIDQPVLGGMTTGAVGAGRPVVQIGMTGNTFRARFRKDQRLVANPAIHPGMLTGQGKTSVIVIKAQRILPEFPARRSGFCRLSIVFPAFKRYFPAGSRMAGGAIDLEVSAVRRLGGQT